MAETIKLKQQHLYNVNDYEIYQYSFGKPFLSCKLFSCIHNIYYLVFIYKTTTS